MRYAVPAPGFTRRPVALETAGILSGARLLQDGAPARKGPKRGTFLLTRDDGGEATARLRPSPFFIDPVPALEVDGERIQLVRPFRPHELVWLALPALLVFVGGALGAIIGIVAATVNAQIMRTGQPLLARYLLTAGVTVFAVGLYGALAILLLGLAGR